MRINHAFISFELRNLIYQPLRSHNQLVAQQVH